MLDKWDRAAKSARKLENHFVADCLEEAVAYVKTYPHSIESILFERLKMSSQDVVYVDTYEVECGNCFAIDIRDVYYNSMTDLYSFECTCCLHEESWDCYD